MFIHIPPHIPQQGDHGGYTWPALTFAFSTAAGAMSGIHSAATVLLSIGAFCGGIASLATVLRNLTLDYRAWHERMYKARNPAAPDPKVPDGRT